MVKIRSVIDEISLWWGGGGCGVVQTSFRVQLRSSCTKLLFKLLLYDQGKTITTSWRACTHYNSTSRAVAGPAQLLPAKKGGKYTEVK